MPRLLLSEEDGYEGQASDAVSACTQVKMEDDRALKLPRSVCPDIWTRLPRHKWPKSWYNVEELVVCSRERNLNGHRLAGLLCDSSKKFWKMVGRALQLREECLFVHRQQGLFLSVHVDDIAMAGKMRNLEPTWKRLMEHVDLGKPTSFLDQVHLRMCSM